MSRTAKAAFALFGLFTCLIVLYTDFYMPKAVAISDYVSTFYVSAHLVATGRADLLYPPANASSFDNTAYNDVAHQLIKDLPNNSTSAYQYPPLLALVLAPLSFLPPNLSLFAFQVISLACLALTTENILFAVLKKEMTRGDILRWTLTSLCFLPVLITLWIGQIGILVGMLPLSIGYRFLLNKSPIKAGLVLSLCMFKPQFSILALFLALAPVVDRKSKCLIAMGFGTAIFLALNLLFFGPQVLGAWFDCLKVSDRAFAAAPAVNVAMATSLPQAIVLMLPPDFVPSCRPYIYLVGAFIGLLGFVTALRLWQSKIKDENKYAGALILGAFATPLTIPHFFLYDYSCLYPAALAVIYTHWHHERRWYFRSVLRLAWLAINVYVLIVAFQKQFAIPLVLIACMLVFFRRLIMIVEEVREKDAVKPVPMANY
jgi:hypothetical protein